MDEKWQKSFPVSWDQFHRDARALVWRLSAAGPFSAVVAVTRGGLVPAAVVARELGIRVIETVCVASYEYDKQSEIQKAYPSVVIGSYPFQAPDGFATNLVLRSRDEATLDLAYRDVCRMAQELTEQGKARGWS